MLKPALKMSNMLKYGSSCVYVNVIDPVLVFSSLSTVVCVGWIISEGKHNAVIDISSTRCFSSPTAAQTGCARLNPDVEAPQRIVLSPPTNDGCPECQCFAGAVDYCGTEPPRVGPLTPFRRIQISLYASIINITPMC